MTGKNLIAGRWESTEHPVTFQTVDPKSNNPLPTVFQEATQSQIESAVEEAAHCAPEMAQWSSLKKANFLSAIKAELEANSTEIIEIYQSESGLPEGRAKGEMQRTLDQIERFVELLQEGSFVQPTLHTSGPDLRKMLQPIGPVVVFGASNFPLAFSTAGGDTISALAAGCPVLVKAHPFHAGTSELVAQAIAKVIETSNLPKGVFSHLGGQSHAVGSQLVSHPLVKGVGFTGSFKGGKALYDCAQKRKNPIPVFAEMGSVNPVFVLQNRLESDENLPSALAQSVTLGTGQFCTNPGLIVICDPEGKTNFGAALAKQVNELQLPPMVHASIQNQYDFQVESLKTNSALTALYFSAQCSAAIGVTTATNFLKHSMLAEEVFGPFTLVVECVSVEEMKTVATHLEGQLTATLLGNDKDQKDLAVLLPWVQEKVGRLLFEGVPTGVAVTQAMHHGGPYPATTDSRYTSVGTDAIYRWLRPVSYQDCPQKLLPAALQNENPLRLLRNVNGTLTTDVL